MVNCGCCEKTLLCKTCLHAVYHQPGRGVLLFGALGYFKLGTLLEVLRRLISYKLTLHVLVTLTEKVVPIHKHITLI